MSWRMLLKHGTAGCLSATGLLSLAERRGLAGRAPVFMYHRVLDEGGNGGLPLQSGMYVLAETFRQQMEYLASRYRVVFLDELIERVATRRSIEGLCAVTFDDGWQDNFCAAFPVLREMGLPATVFLATGYTGTERLFWPDEFSLLLTRCGNALHVPSAGSLPPSAERFLRDLKTPDGIGTERIMERGIELLKRKRPGERREILDILVNRVSLPHPGRQMLDWDEVGLMHASGLIRFGAHTVNHELLDQLPPERALDEIEQSAGHLAERLGRPTTLFAYPNGNHSGRVRRLLRRAGFQAAVTTSRGCMGHDSPLLELPRIGVHEDVGRTVPLFRARTVVPGF